MRRDGLLLTCGLLICGCHRGGGESAARPPTKVRCGGVVERNLRDLIEVRGTIAPLPDRDVRVAPQVSGRLLAVEVREGAEVAAGQVVARVDGAPLADGVRRAGATLAKAEAELQNAQTTLARTRQVFARGIAPRQEVDDAVAKEATARATVADAQAAAREARRQLQRAVVRSPLKGVVLKLLRRPGELVDGTPATPVVEVADTAVLDLVADVPGGDLVRLARNLDASIVFPAIPGHRFAGRITMVSPAVDRLTGVGTVRITLAPTPAPRPPVGMYGTARVETGAPHTTLLVPAKAVRALVGAEGEVVVCGADGRAHVRKVRVAGARDGLTIVEEAKAGERVAVDPVLGLAEGDAIEVTR